MPGMLNAGSNYGVNLTEKGFLGLKGLGDIPVLVSEDHRSLLHNLWCSEVFKYHCLI